MTMEQEAAIEVEPPFKDDGEGSVVKFAGEKPLDQWSARRVRMTLNQFTFFAAVAKYRSITKASAKLRISQPSITQQLKQLEAHHGTKLYHRLSKGIEITEAGQMLLQKIEPILAQVASMENGSKPAPSKANSEVLKIGGIFCASAELLPSLLARLRSRYPHADLEFRTGKSEQLERMVLGSAMDLAVIARPAYSQELRSELLRREKLALFVPADHELAKMDGLTLADIAGKSFIIRGGRGISGITENAVKELRRRGMDIKIGLRCEDPTAVKAGVRQGMGIGIAFEETVKAEIRAGEFAVLNIPGLTLSAKSFVIHKKINQLSPLAQEFLELLRGVRVDKETSDTAGYSDTPPKRKSTDLFVPRRLSL